MKIKILKKFKTKLLKFKLLKTKIYNYKNGFGYWHIKNTEIRLKQIFHILYKFHVTNKKILFVGNPHNVNDQIKQFLQTKQHKFLPDSLWMDGIFTNPKTSFKHLKQQYALTNNKSLKILLSLRTQIDLIVILNERRNINILNESSLKRIPIITLNSTYNLSRLDLSTYTIPDDSNFVEKPSQENFFFLVLHSILKKAEILKKKLIQSKLKEEELKRKRKHKWQKKKFKRKHKWQKKNLNIKVNNKKNVFTKKK